MNCGINYFLLTNGCGLTNYNPSWHPYVTTINMDNPGCSTNCSNYINKLTNFAARYSPGQLAISASSGGYGDANFYFDDTQTNVYTNNNKPLYGLSASNALFLVGVPSSCIFETNDGTGNNDCGLPCHITNGMNLAGYWSYGAHSTLWTNYALNGSVKWNGNSGWYAMGTVESFNGLSHGGQPARQGNYIDWFSSNAFGGANYANTPVGAYSYVNEPTTAGTVNPVEYYPLWAAGNYNGICAWTVSVAPGGYGYKVLQVIGDPFLTK